MNLYEQPIIVIEDGPGKGDTYPLGNDPMTLGRARDNTVFVNDTRVSRYHARIQAVAGGAFVVEDLGSTNGTFVNGTLITGPQQVSPNDIIELGDCLRMRLVIPQSQAAYTPPPPTVVSWAQPQAPAEPTWEAQGPGGTVWITPEPQSPMQTPPPPMQPYGAPPAPAATQKSKRLYIAVGCLVLLLCLCIALAAGIWFAPTSFWQSLGLI